MLRGLFILPLLLSLLSSCAVRRTKNQVVSKPIPIDSSQSFRDSFYEYLGRSPLICTRRIVPVDTAFSRGIYQLHLQELVDTLKLPPSLYGDTSQWIGAPNFGMRNPNFVIIHHTAQNSALYTTKFFIEKVMPVSAHYLISRDGTIYPLVHNQLRAWHAGVAKWGSVTDLNSVSIGIELDNNGKEEFPQVQIDSLISLLTILKAKYKIPTSNFLGHADIAPGRKQDPNLYFPWKYLADKGFGFWYDDVNKIKLPTNFDGWFALRLLGYDIRRPEAALQAFRRHYFGNEKLNKIFSNLELKVLFSLCKKILCNYD